MNFDVYNQAGGVTSGEIVLWALPNSAQCIPPVPLGCMEIGEVAESFGDFLELLCRDLSRPNTWKTIKKVRNQAESIGFTVSGRYTKTASYLSRLDCAFTLYITIIDCGLPQNEFENWQGGFFLTNVEKSQRTISGLEGAYANQEAFEAFDLSAESLVDFRKKTSFTISTGQAVDILGHAVSGTALCAATDDCDTTETTPNQFQLATLGNGNALYTADSGTNWSAAGQPFGDAGTAIAVTAVTVGGSTTRFLAFRADNVGGNGLEVAYTDNGGTSWTVVQINATAGATLTTKNAVWTNGFNQLLVADSTGSIYVSENAGLTWTLQASGLAASLSAIHMRSGSEGYAVGAAGTVFRYNGNSWSAVTVTGANANTHVMNMGSAVFVTDNSANMFRSTDRGQTWSAISFVGAGSGSIIDMFRINDVQAGFIHRDGGNQTVQTTITRGCSWRIEDLPAGVALFNSFAAGGDFDRLYASGVGGAMVGIFDLDLAG